VNPFAWMTPTPRTMSHTMRRATSKNCAEHVSSRSNTLMTIPKRTRQIGRRWELPFSWIGSTNVLLRCTVVLNTHTLIGAGSRELGTQQFTSHTGNHILKNLTSTPGSKPKMCMASVVNTTMDFQILHPRRNQLLHGHALP